MIRPEKISEFMGWTKEERELCVSICRAIDSGAEPNNMKQTQVLPRPKKRRSLVKRENSCKPWTDDEDLAILEAVAEYGSTNKAWGILSRELKRSRKAVGVRYYSTLNSKSNHVESAE